MDGLPRKLIIFGSLETSSSSPPSEFPASYKLVSEEDLEVPSKFQALIAFCFIIGLAAQCSAQEPDPTKWTSAAGKTIEAEFVRMEEDGVVLKLKENGQQATVPLSTLSLQSHLMAIKLAKPAEFSKPLVKAPIAEVVESPEMVIPDYQGALVSPFNESQSLKQFVDVLTGELDRGNFYVIWHAIPEKMQQDIVPLMLQSSEQMGEDNIKKIGEIIKSAHTLLREKKEYVFANQKLMEKPEVRKQLYAYWEVAEKMVGALNDEELWVVPTEENYERLNARQACVYGAEFLFLKELIAQETGFPIPSFSSILGVASSKEDVGRLRIQLPIPIPIDDITVRKIKGNWVVPALMNPLREQLDQAPQLAENAEVKQAQAQMNAGLNMAKLLLDQFAAADSQEDFDRAMTTYGDMIFTGLEAVETSAGSNPLAGMFGGMGGPPGMGRPGRGNQGMGMGGIGGQGDQGFGSQGGGRRGGGLGGSPGTGDSSPGGGRRGGGLGGSPGTGDSSPGGGRRGGGLGGGPGI